MKSIVHPPSRPNVLADTHSLLQSMWDLTQLVKRCKLTQPLGEKDFKVQPTGWGGKRNIIYMGGGNLSLADAF